MALPKIDKPIYTMIAPSDGREMKYRPYTVKEEKILLTAQQSKSPKQSFIATKQVLTNCIIDEDIDTMPMIDVEFALISIRSKSVGNIIEFSIKGDETNERIKAEIDLNLTTIVKNPDHNKHIKLNDEFTLIMKYPTINEAILVLETETIEERTAMNYIIMRRCLDKLVTEDSVSSFANETDEDIDSWLDDLDSKVREKMQQFFDTAPVVKYEFPYVTKSGEKKTLVIQGLESFFT